MEIKIYLLKPNKRPSYFPTFTIGFDNALAAQAAFNELYKDLTIKNTDYIICKAAIFKREDFDKAILC